MTTAGPLPNRSTWCRTTGDTSTIARPEVPAPGRVLRGAAPWRVFAEQAQDVVGIDLKGRTTSMIRSRPARRANPCLRWSSRRCHALWATASPAWRCPHELSVIQLPDRALNRDGRSDQTRSPDHRRRPTGCRRSRARELRGQHSCLARTGMAPSGSLHRMGPCRTSPAQEAGDGLRCLLDLALPDVAACCGSFGDAGRRA